MLDDYQKKQLKRMTKDFVYATSLAVVLTAVPHLPTFLSSKMAALFLNLEGTLLLAFSLDFGNQALKWIDKLIPQGAQPVYFRPLMFWAGLICLAASAIINYLR